LPVDVSLSVSSATPAGMATMRSQRPAVPALSLPQICAPVSTSAATTPSLSASGAALSSIVPAKYARSPMIAESENP
jgi:hypothetical protein